MVDITVDQLLGHKVLQPGHVPQLPPPSLGAGTAINHLQSACGLKVVICTTWLTLTSTQQYRQSKKHLKQTPTNNMVETNENLEYQCQNKHERLQQGNTSSSAIARGCAMLLVCEYKTSSAAIVFYC